ncbi:uncharacterized protein LACBIDRAFT_296423 [Laccaria bicolor S238N-H82]|uniref:Predicted protein n=1 Tax=Laccaria bicolor (strain S238N-H82 / ATCC MYA-4686) TaxID=486041 RepID=B0D8S3_LACBS|nr:uncharacterized protein LACBIDRAFT_296423 [Laccaria bicolor S238N-H82]EDR08893.1 predicted protein [Laccaria bicolor S238N-H82]|eukprot:XP_001880206.1 predicted protein [Laccaria bicolor S238N-H82]
MAEQKVSFTIRRPTPVSRAASPGNDSDTTPSFKLPSLPRHLSSTPQGSPLARSTTSSPKPTQVQHSYPAGDDSSEDEDAVVQDELVTGFDKFGVQRLTGERKFKQEPLVIPALKNKDWRALALKRRSAGQYVPASAKAETGKDGSVGGLGTRDSINSGPVLSGLQVKKREGRGSDEHLDHEMTEDLETTDVKMEDEETEDQKALRAILAETNGVEHDGPVVDIIPTPISETDALKQDVDELPDVATPDDYARVPVSQFGAALLRGMGWKEGTAASRKPGKGMVEPYLPTARPALLGIGAKEQEVYDDGSKRKASKNTRPERRYVPIIKKERNDNSGSTSEGRRRERSLSPRRGSAPVSRRGSRSPRRSRERDTRDGSDPGYKRRDNRRGDSSPRERTYEYEYGRSKERNRGGYGDGERGDRSRESGRK